MEIQNNTKNNSKPTKREIIFDDEDRVTIWRYDYSITTKGPVQVEVKYKANYKDPVLNKKKTLGDLAKEARKEAKLKKTKP